MAFAFNVGEVYFRVKYAEPERKYPLIDSLVFVGRNLSDEDETDTWYFQFAESFAKFGSVVTESGGDRRVSCVTEDEIKDMMDADGLILELDAAKRRRLQRA